VPGSSWSVLRYRDYRLMYFSQMISVTGGSMLLAAANWHIWNLTHDEAALGLLGLVRVVPIIALSLIGGVVSDAVNRRRLLLSTQFATIIFTVALFAVASQLAAEALNKDLALLLIYILLGAIAGIGAFESPARYALMPSLIPDNRIGDAARLNVVLFTVTSVFGPLLATAIMNAAGTQNGPSAVYGLIALTVIPSMIVLLIISVPAKRTLNTGGVSLQSLREGLGFVFGTPLLRWSMLVDFFATFFSSALLLLPVYADRILDVGLEGYGVLYAAPFVGSTLGAIVMAQTGSRLKRQGELMLGAVIGYGLATVVFGLSQTFWISLLALAGIGLTDSLSAAVRNALRQTLTPPRLRGRMQSVMMLFFLGGPQLGEFEAGLLARATSVQFSVVSGGVITVLVVGLMAALIPTLRNYRELPEAVTD
jgi:MFS family permease